MITPPSCSSRSFTGHEIINSIKYNITLPIPSRPSTGPTNFAFKIPFDDKYIYNIFNMIRVKIELKGTIQLKEEEGNFIIYSSPTENSRLYSLDFYFLNQDWINCTVYYYVESMKIMKQNNKTVINCVLRDSFDERIVFELINDDTTYLYLYYGFFTTQKPPDISGNITFKVTIDFLK